MSFVNKLLIVALISTVLSSGALYATRYMNSPLILEGRGSALLFSNNYYFKNDGDIKQYLDYHTVNYGIVLPKVSHSTRKIVTEDDSRVVINYYLEFYGDIIELHGIEFPQGLDLSGNPIDAEAHALNQLDHHQLQLMHMDNKLFCFSNLLTGSVKCTRHMNNG
ncbi:hypothetical protein TW78_09425 [Vibrio coralliilyticus]|uniref:Uncharacterized protein n=1 Tax=Vibrio coralliilyticus TaxID=190893 RepID=A0A837G8U9_9VIBR|nr:hypothetical protein [Vibrio coralliilyticus]ARC94888.1 hypothetical protein B6A42_25785 [Vibrio coralliilyticus]KJY73397.1 hypothetical protein TW78_09425 [Vibrio coralliilyticus]QOU33187.1 hypothetical protein TW71_024715 [Vibrio coralliilyticus]